MPLDPRQLIKNGALKADLSEAGGRKWSPEKTTIFLLVPSTSSSAEHLMQAEIALQALGSAFFLFDNAYAPEIDEAFCQLLVEKKQIRFIRLDDWHAHGDEILVKMMEAGAVFYPLEEKDAMFGMFEAPAPIVYLICLYRPARYI